MIRRASPHLGRRHFLGGLFACGPVFHRNAEGRVASTTVPVTELGADPTGTDDSSGAIQRALDTGAPQVLIPEGKYRLDRSLIVSNSGQAVIGFGRRSVLYTTDPLTNGIEISTGTVGARVADFVLLGCSSQPEKHRHVGLLINATNSRLGAPQQAEVVIFGVTLSGTTRETGWSIGIHGHRSSGLTVEHCLVDSIIGQKSGSGYGILATGSEVTIRQCSILANNLKNGRHGIYLGFGGNSLVESNYISGFIGSGICSNTSTQGSDSNIAIRSNFVMSCGYGTPYNDDSAIGLYMQGGISAAGSGCAIEGNTVVASGAHAVFANGHSRLSVANNDIREFSLTTSKAHRAISIWAGNDINIRANRISNRAQDTISAIELRRVRSANVANNKLYDPTRPVRRSWIKGDDASENVILDSNEVSSELDILP